MTEEINNMDEQQKIAEVLKKMSDESGLDIQALTQEYQALITEVGSPIGALAKLKSSHKFQLGGKTGDFTARVVGKGKTREGRGYMDLWVQTGEGTFEKAPRRLWDNDKTTYSTGVQLSQVVEYAGKLMPKGDTTIVTSGALNPSTKPFPTVQELVKSVGSIPLKELDKHAKTNGFVTGVVGKIFSSKYGGGVEICNPLDIDSVPITVYVEEGTSAVEGQELIVYGYINQKATGDITINAGGVF